LSLLTIESASLEFDSKRLWHNLSLEVNEGEFIALIGPNGSGKSMLLKSIVGTQKLSAGEIRFLGAEPGYRNSSLGYIPQHRATDSGLPLKVSDCVGFGLDGHLPGLPLSSESRRKKIAEALELVDASSLANKTLGSLSGGEMQRVRVAQAIISEPKLLLADEPLSALDLKHQMRISELIDEQAKNLGSAVIFVAHDLNPIIDFVDRVIYIAQGRHTIGTPDEVMRSDVLSELYGADIDVVRNQGRVVVLGAHDHEHHEDERWH
jgi:zinc/manganese transport system ATP-binding protein